MQPSYRLKFTDQRLSSDNLFCYTIVKRGMGYNMKKIIWWIIALLCTGSLLYYGYSLYTGTKFKEENGTNTNPASKDLEEFYNELEEYYPEFYKNIATSIRATYVIPGLVQAETI